MVQRITFDLETTGADVPTARIVQIAIRALMEDGEVKEWEQLINPGIPIPEEATNVHGITDEMVKDSKTFAEWSQVLLAKMSGVDLSGYNIINFDIPVLAEEFARCNLDWDISNVRIFDTMKIWNNLERRRLEDAVMHFTGETIKDAHDALGDVRSSDMVLDAQMKKHVLTPEHAAHASVSKWEGDEMVPVVMVDFAGKLSRNEKGNMIYNFGKAKGKEIMEDRGFGDWMFKQNFIPETTKRILRKEMGLASR